MIEFELPITVAITTWNNQDSIAEAVKSVSDLADNIVIVYGRLKDIDADTPDDTFDILKHLQIDYPDLITLVSQYVWNNEAERLNVAWFNSIGFFFRMRGKEVLSEKLKQDLEKLIPLSIAENIPLISCTTQADTYEIRGCQVDYTKVWEDTNCLPGIYDPTNKKALQINEAISVFIPEHIS